MKNKKPLEKYEQIKDTSVAHDVAVLETHDDCCNYPQRYATVALGLCIFFEGFKILHIVKIQELWFFCRRALRLLRLATWRPPSLELLSLKAMMELSWNISSGDCLSKPCDCLSEPYDDHHPHSSYGFKKHLPNIHNPNMEYWSKWSLKLDLYSKFSTLFLLRTKHGNINFSKIYLSFTSFHKF